MFKGLQLIEKKNSQEEYKQERKSDEELDNTENNVKNEVITGGIRMTSDSIFEARRKRVQEYCALRDKNGGYTPDTYSKGLVNLFTHDQSGTLYCSVPKTGCTFWKLLFKAASSVKEGEVCTFYSSSVQKCIDL